MPQTPSQTRYDSEGFAIPFSTPHITPIDWDDFIEFDTPPPPPDFVQAESPHTPRTPEPEAQLAPETHERPEFIYSNSESDSSTESVDSESTQSWDVRNGPRPVDLTPHPPRRRDRSFETDRDTRIKIQAGIMWHVPHALIRETLDVTDRQIRHAKNHRVTPQKALGRRGKTKLHTPQRRRLEAWLLESPSHRHMPWYRIPGRIGEDWGTQAVSTAFKLLGYVRRTSHKKGFSDDAEDMRMRVLFCQNAKTWTRERLNRQMFSDEVWAMGGAHTTAYITCKKDGSDRYNKDNIQHKYSKLPSWMFHGTIINGHKGPARFWEKWEGTMDSTKYDRFILT